MNQDISFGQIVRERRRALDLTQAELARRVGCATVTIRKIEYDSLRPSQQIAELLAKSLAIPLEERAAFVRLARTVLRDTPEPSPLPTPPPTPDEIGGQDLSGRAIRGYALGERIGAGGFGAVYRAVQPLVEREVAVKIILPQYADHPEFIRRFEAEAQVVARLEHPHIVPLYDYWREPGVAYLVMRLLRGGSLQALLKDGPLALDRVTSLLEQIGAALHAAHRIGVIHRDLKPANVLLDEDGNGYLADFGIAKNLNVEDQTQMGAVIGSPAYLSPEQILSEPIKPQADVYSLGVMLYELLTGQKPFKGPTPIDLIQQHLDQSLPPLATQYPGLSPALDAVIERATAKKPMDRYPDVPSLLADYRTAVTPATEAAQIPYAVAISDEGLENPYKGLRAFGEADADDFFGRSTLTQELLGRLAEAGDASVAGQDLARFLAVVGSSGSGKSSVVKAGLIPALRRGGLPSSENWFIVDLLPGAHPWEELEAALLRIAVNPPESLLAQLQANERGLLRAVRRVLPADQATELVLVIDQFEEIFTLTEDETARALLLDSLVTATLDPRSRLRVIITLRADFTDRPLQYVDFGELVRQRTEFVLPLSPDEVEEAIIKPAERVGLAVEPGLAETIIGDLGDQPGMLPLLQYTLTELFERRVGRALTLGAYQASGGVRGALASRADELYAQLDEAGQKTARRLFLRLIAPGEISGEGLTAPDTRRRVLRSELASLNGRATSVMDTVIDTFGRHRLLTFDRDPATRGPTVEVAHEALIREWGRLRGWLEEDREFLLWGQRLRAALHQWEASQEDEGALLRGAPLAEAENWLNQRQTDLSQTERAFIQAGLELRERRAAEREAQRQRELEAAQKLAEAEKQRAEEQARAAGRLRRRALLLAGVSLIAIVLAVAAVFARATARQERDNAQREAAVNHSLVLAANAQQAHDTGEVDLALALALEAISIDQPPSEARRTLSAIALGPGTRAVFKGHSNAVMDVAFGPDGKTALSGSCGELDSDHVCVQGELILWDLEAETELRRPEGHTGWVNSLAFSPDTGGKTALSGSSDGTLILWDFETGEMIRRFEGHGGGVNGVTFSPDGQTALSGSDDTTLILWNVDTGRKIRHFEGHAGGVNTIAFSPDGQTVLSGSDDTTLILWDVATAEAIRRFEGHTDGVTDVVFNLDGRTMLSASDDNTLRLWALETGEEIRQQFFGSGVENLVISPDGRTAMFGAHNDVRLWDIEQWRETGHLYGHSDEIEAVAISPDGRLTLSASADGTLRLWSPTGQAEFRHFETDGTPLVAVDVDSSGRYLLTGDFAGDVVLWDVLEGKPIRRFEGDGFPIHPGAVAFSPDGKYVLVGAGDAFGGSGAKSLVLWDIETGEEIHRFEGHKEILRSVAFGPDGRSALAGSQGIDGSLEGDLILWDLETGEQIRRFDTKEDITSIVFSADSSRALSSSAYFANLILWDVATGREIRRFEGHTNVVLAVAYGPDETTALSASGDGSLILWDVETGEPIRRYLGHDSAVWGLDVSPDGRFAISGSDGATVILWDFETGEELRRFSGHTAMVLDVVFSPDVQTAFSVSFDGALIQWHIADQPLDELIEWTQAHRYIRDLTCDERGQYRVEPLCDAEGGVPMIAP
jgi:WD40 repeat protein/transcriptional regulator with XRE-family HTH domain